MYLVFEHFAQNFFSKSHISAHVIICTRDHIVLCNWWYMFQGTYLIFNQSQGRTKSLLFVKPCPFELYFGLGPWINGSPVWINTGFIFKLVLYIVEGLINLGSYILEWHFGSRFYNWKSLPKSIFDFWFRIRISPKVAKS